MFSFVFFKNFTISVNIEQNKQGVNLTLKNLPVVNRKINIENLSAIY